LASCGSQEAGGTTADVCRRYGVSEATFYKWKAKYGGLEVSEARRLKALEAAFCAEPGRRALQSLALFSIVAESFRPSARVTRSVLRGQPFITVNF